MSQPARALAPLPFELVFSDGEPLESEWHTYQFPLLRDLISQALAEQGRNDFYVGGDMFVYYSYQQAEGIVRGKRYFRGPDVFWVGGVKPGYREGWVSWEEGGRLPDVIIELLSSSTAHIDRKDKRKLYAEVFHTAEYYLYDPETRELEGLRLKGTAYQSMAPDDKGRFWSDQLGVYLGLWHGTIGRCENQDWVRLFRPNGNLVPMDKEQVEVERQRAEAEHQRAEAERQRAEAAEAEVARLRALLEERGLS